jgi:type III pantothenate kinase
VEKAYLAADDLEGWDRQRREWNLTTPTHWAVASVQPSRCEALLRWLRMAGDEVLVIDKAEKLALRVLLEKPDHAGIDRLLDAVAANALRRPGHPAVVVDAGSAVTVDWVNPEGAFCGGAILPGLRLMAAALRDYTALLPQVTVHEPAPLPGRSTIAAMEGGIFWSVAGGIVATAEAMVKQTGDTAGIDVILTGGDARKLEWAVRAALLPPTFTDVRIAPLLTLEGIRLAAEALS